MNTLDIKKEVNIVSFDISGARIDLFKRAVIGVIFRCIDGDTIYKEVILQGDDYLQWGIYDDYIVEYITKNAPHILDS